MNFSYLLKLKRTFGNYKLSFKFKLCNSYISSGWRDSPVQLNIGEGTPLFGKPGTSKRYTWGPEAGDYAIKMVFMTNFST